MVPRPWSMRSARPEAVRSRQVGSSSIGQPSRPGFGATASGARCSTTAAGLQDRRLRERARRLRARPIPTSTSGAPAVLVLRCELMPEAGLRLSSRARRFHHRPDLGLLLLEERLEALPVGPLIEDHQPAAVVRAVEAVRDEAVLLSGCEDRLHLVPVLVSELLQPLWIAPDLKAHDHRH